jgi:hypothetical protein
VLEQLQADYDDELTKTIDERDSPGFRRPELAVDAGGDP